MAALAVAGPRLWRSHNETVAKAALSAEIEAERAARVWPAEPEPTAEERKTATLYLLALKGLKLDAYYEGFSEAMSGTPWSAVPEPVVQMLAANAEPLAIVDCAVAHGACRFQNADRPPAHNCMKIHRLLLARGHAALARREWVAAAEEVRRLVCVSRDLAAIPRIGGEKLEWLVPYIDRTGTERGAATLLSLLATAPDLPSEAGPALAAAAREEWGTRESNRLSIDLDEDSSDAITLRSLAPDAEADLDEKDAKQNDRGVFEKISDFFRGVRRHREPDSTKDPIPTAAAVRSFRDQRAPIVAAQRRRDMAALAPGGAFDKAAGWYGFLSPLWFRRTVVYEARVEVARAAAAIRAFQLAERRPPRALEELVPAVLSEVPLDPFDGKPLLYEVDGEAWRVASRVWREPPKEGDDEEPFPPGEVSFPRPAKPPR